MTWTWWPPRSARHAPVDAVTRRGAAKLRVRLSTLQYLVPTLFGGKVTWVAYFEHARYALGDAAGRYQRAFP
jgi:hypothetical protein